MKRPTKNKSLKSLTTFNIGGAARWFVEAYSIVDIKASLAYATKKQLPLKLFGGGSNTLVADEGFPGIVVHIACAANEISDTRVVVEAGADLLSIVRATAAAGLSGLERLAGIPGSLGGAVRGNAGAFGVHIGAVVESVMTFNMLTGETLFFSNEQCMFSYRSSIFKMRPELAIMKVTLALAAGDAAGIHGVIEQTIADRERRHLQNVKAAGSFFMNPIVSTDIQEQFEAERHEPAREGRVPAGWLIEKVGLKGAHFGAAASSSQHANYIINTGGATAREVIILAGKIKAAVRERFSVDLEEEVTFLG